MMHVSNLCVSCVNVCSLVITVAFRPAEARHMLHPPNVRKHLGSSFEAEHCPPGESSFLFFSSPFHSLSIPPSVCQLHCSVLCSLLEKTQLSGCRDVWVEGKNHLENYAAN